jgi:hypothetical protein
MTNSTLKYTHRRLSFPVVAYQYCGGDISSDWPSWMRFAYERSDIYSGGKAFGDLVVRMRDGSSSLYPGDWLLLDVEGEMYPVRDSVFKKTYEKID